MSPLAPRVLGRLVGAAIALGIGAGGFVVLRDVFHVGALAGTYAALLALVLAVALVITLGD